MEFGMIKRSSGQITLDEFDVLIRADKRFVFIPDRIGQNPFTKEKVIFPGKGAAYYQVNNKNVGNIVLSEGAIYTTGVPQEICEQVAITLKANVFEHNDS